MTACPTVITWSSCVRRSTSRRPFLRVRIGRRCWPKVERRLSVVEELESVVTANLQRATRLRQSILQKAFTGELVGDASLLIK